MPNRTSSTLEQYVIIARGDDVRMTVRPCKQITVLDEIGPSAALVRMTRDDAKRLAAKYPEWTINRDPGPYGFLTS